MKNPNPPIRTHLPNPTRDAVATELQATLFELVDLALKGKQLHWNVVGPRFRAVHELLDENIAEHRGWSDTVAERCAALGVAPSGEAKDVAKTNALPPLPEGYVSDDTAVELQGSNIAWVSGRVRERIARVGDMDPATEDLFIEILRGLEMQSWMLQAIAARPEQLQSVTGSTRTTAKGNGSVSPTATTQPS